MSFEKTFCDLVAKNLDTNSEENQINSIKGETRAFEKRMLELNKAMNHMAQAFDEVLTGLNMAFPNFDIKGPNLEKTPQRMARALIEMCSGLGVQDKEIFTQSFPAADYEEMIIVKNIEFTSLCSHHFIPFKGQAHVGYIPSSNGNKSKSSIKVVGLSKIARAVDSYAKRPQLQERMSVEIMEAIKREINPQGIIVLLEATHGCLSCRGAQKSHAVMITSTTDGVFKKDIQLRNEFLQLIRGQH